MRRRVSAHRMLLAVAALGILPAVEARADEDTTEVAGPEGDLAPRRRRPREPYAADEVSPFVRNELALAGTVVFGTGYFTGIFVLAPQGFPKGSTAMLAPVAGPWITLALREDDGAANEGGKRAFIAANGVVQGAGAAMFLIAQLLPVTDPMHSGGDYFSVVPDGSGLRASGSF